MRITFLGHSGLFIETKGGSILCDPWFYPAYFASWFPFPSNEAVDLKAIGNPDYLYISHEHHDHLDGRFLREHVCKDATVLLPDYPVRSLERALRGLGFSAFLRTDNAKVVDMESLRVAIVAMISPSDGPEGDSGLIVDDGRSRIFNQNDCRPVDIDAIQQLGPYDAHFLQFSGATWYPMVYSFPSKVKKALGEQKRANQLARAFAFVEQVDASYVFPCGGPPCFLDDDLFHLNDICADPSNTFCDQTVFLEHMRESGSNRGHLVIPGSVMELDGSRCSISHPIPDKKIEAMFRDKASYLEAYRRRKAPEIKAARSAWPSGRIDILASLRERFEPLLAIADLACAGVDGRILLDCSVDKIVLDFQDRNVYRWSGQECKYKFRIDAALIEACIVNEEVDWVNSLFLSYRFRAEREGPYNEYVYNFFKCLSLERLQYAEGYYAEQTDGHELFRIDGHMIQRRCPHLKADLARFGRAENGILTCTMHGWRFDIATGRCLTSDQCKLYTEPVDSREEHGD